MPLCKQVAEEVGKVEEKVTVTGSKMRVMPGITPKTHGAHLKVKARASLVVAVSRIGAQGPTAKKIGILNSRNEFQYRLHPYPTIKAL